MAFWIVVGILSLIVLGTIIHRIREYNWEDGVAGGVVAFVIIAIVGFVVVGGGSNSSAIESQRLKDTYGLRALVTKEDVETHGEIVYFLGFGGGSTDTSSVTSISYIRTADDGGATLRTARIDESVIYEDGTEEPYVEDWETVRTTTGWWLPWEMQFVNPHPEHRFHIPAGSILESYEVAP